MLHGAGRTRLALYGLGNIRDERLFHTFEARKVHMVRPQHEPDSWFNLMTLHQNRYGGGLGSGPRAAADADGRASQPSDAGGPRAVSGLATARPALCPRRR